MSGERSLVSPPTLERMALVPSTASTSQQQQPPPQQAASSPKPYQLVPSGQPGQLLYPTALANHEAVLTNRDLFYDTLNNFHAALGTRLMIPTIGGKELDLHLLYVEVSARGGLEQVIKDRKWKEVTLVFNFPPTTTSASYVLRKYYITLLHHYEQVYFFGAQGQLVPPPAPLPCLSPGNSLADNGFVNHGTLANHGAMEAEPVVKKRRGALDPTQLYGVDVGALVGHTVSGFIDGKFEHGYLVTIIVGTEKLRGVLYHMPPGSLAPQFAAVPGMASGIGVDSAPEVGRKRRRRRKDEMPKKDPNAPKPNRSGYNFFFQEQHMRLKALHPDKDKDISRMIGELWNKQTEEEKAVYQEQGMKDKERYKREMEEYRGRLKMEAHCKGNGIEDVTQLIMGSEDMNKIPDHTFAPQKKNPDHQISGVDEAGSCPMAVLENNPKGDVTEKSYSEPIISLAEEAPSVTTRDQGTNR